MPDVWVTPVKTWVCRARIRHIIAGALVCCAACQSPPPGPTTDAPSDRSQDAPFSTPASSASPLFGDVAAHVHQLQCTITSLSFAHGQWAVQNTSRVLTFDRVLGTAELHRWQAAHPDGTQMVIDSRADGSSVYWLHDVALLLPSALTGSCGADPFDNAQRQTVCAQPITGVAEWGITAPAEVPTTPALSAALQDFHYASDDASPDTEQCQVLGARWSSVAPLPSATEVLTRWCPKSGPLYLQTRSVMAGIARWSIQRCRTEQERATSQSPP